MANKKELTCSICLKTKNEEEFTKFTKNISLKNRNYRTYACKDCCIEMIENSTDKKESMKQVCRINDLPFVEKTFEVAVSNYDKKNKSKKIVKVTSVQSGKIESEQMVSNRLQDSLYTCYTSRLGIIKDYTNYAESQMADLIKEKKENEKNSESAEIEKAKKWLINYFKDDSILESENIKSIVEFKLNELSLYKNNPTKRSEKFNLKTNIKTLCENGYYDKKDYPCIYEEVKKEVDETKDKEIKNLMRGKNYDLDTLRDFWGEEYADRDLVKFQKEYERQVKNYELKTEQHVLFLKIAVINWVKANDCYAIGDVANASKYMTMFKDATTGGKLSPASMNTLQSSGGLNSFSEFYAMVEKSKDYIKIPDMIKKFPQDKADLVIWCNVNYIRKLLDYEPCKYEEIYGFYDGMAKEWEQEMIKGREEIGYDGENGGEE